jgi:hypothetical protein
MERTVGTRGFRVIALQVEVADEVRRTMVAPGYGHPAHAERATGSGPCRVCLRTFAVKADRRILFTHDPFDGLEREPLPGPIYVHARPCRRYPETAGFPEDLRSIPITLNGYGPGRTLLVQERVSATDAEEAIERILAKPEVGYVHVRNTDAGCYIARVERAD